MRIYVLFAQRRESYSGEHAPEVLAAIDEFANDESPEDLMAQIIDEHRAELGSDIVAIGWVSMDVDPKAVRARLIPSLVPVRATLAE